ncbi:MAG TPA: CbiX/SirB N-terminal domain-containing protein [Chroococcales cyanobacterium]
MTQALLIVDHGSVKQESNLLVEQLAQLIASLRTDLKVHFAHLDLAEPTIEQGFQRCVEDGASEVIVHPYMLAAGRHATEDVPNTVAAIAGRFPHVKVRVTDPLGLHRKLAEVVLERAALA